ncbi:sodium/potassium/calcium exchanger 3-like isoform X2 [Stigmatopora argus]
MKNLVDAANDKMTVLPSEKDIFKQRVEMLEQTITTHQLVKLPPVDDFDVKQSTKENESNLIKEENEKLLAKVRRLQVQREQDKRSLSEFSVVLKNIEGEAFQQKEEFIQQNKLQLKQAEETVEEYSNIIKDLRQANQELRSQLEDREGEALLATSIDSVGENEASHIPEMTFAEEIMLLVAPVEMKSTTEASMDSVQEDTKAEELSSPPSNHPTNSHISGRRRGEKEATCSERASRRVVSAAGMKAPRRARQTLLLPRLCVCGLGLLAATWVVHPNDDSVDVFLSKKEVNTQKDDNNQSSVSVSESAISEFPEDVFTLEQRRQGAVVLHVLCAIYMFHALAIVCDVYFVPSLEKVSENLQLSQDVAGATFMAAGSSAPELFTSLIGVFITKGDVGVGTIVGSAVFNILVIIGICGIFADQPILLSWWPLFRDASFYILSIILLIVVIYDEKVQWWETIILISMYGIYILIMKYNSSLCSLVVRYCSPSGQPCLSTLRRATAVGNATECDADVVPLKPDSCAVVGQDAGVVMVDEQLNLNPQQLTFSEASLRLLITSHFPPFTRLRMAGRTVISERQRLIRAQVIPKDGAASADDGGASGGRENGSAPEAERPPLGARVENETGRQVGIAAGAVEDEEEEEQEEMAPFKPFIIPDGWCVRVRWLLSWPVNLLLHCTVPDCNLPQWERWFLLTFLASTLWIALFSYLMVWMVTIISYTLGIPEVIMGITFLAAGTSVPDCMASLIVARRGLGDMAVSNSIGSNIFDVLLGLGFPWALRTLLVSYGSVVTINSRGLLYSVILLLASVTLTVLSVHLNRWKLDRRLGLWLMLLYVIFLLCSIVFEELFSLE